MTIDEVKRAVFAEKYPKEQASALARGIIELYKPGEYVPQREVCEKIGATSHVVAAAVFKLLDLGYLKRIGNQNVARTEKYPAYQWRLKGEE